MKPATAGVIVTAAATLAVVGANRLAPCPLTGDARRNSLEFRLNPLKNRTDLPKSVKPIAIADWLALKADAPITDVFGVKTTGDADKADAAEQLQSAGVQLTGYVREVKSGGPESCGCHSTTDLDIHIELVPSQADAGNEMRVVVVEVTPQFQHLHPDWTLASLRAKLKGGIATFTGLPFADLEHKSSSFADSPRNQHDWRGTVWELHPVTAIEIPK